MGNPRGVRRDFKALEKRRLQALNLFAGNLNNSEIGRRLKVSNQTVSRWRNEIAVGGPEVLKSAGRAGRKPQLSEADKQALVRPSSKVCWPGQRSWGIRRHSGHASE